MFIPKTIIQTSPFEFPKYYKNHILRENKDWEYKYFSDEDIEQFIIDNPIPELEDSLQIFKEIKKGEHKADFFRYYYLYLNGGVYIDYDMILNTSLTKLLNNISFFTCKSVMNNHLLCNGFIGCEPKNKIIYEALKRIYFLDKTILDIDYFINCKDLYLIINNYKNIISSLFVISEDILNTKCKIFNERSVVRTFDGAQNIYYDLSENSTELLSGNKVNEKLSYTEIYDDDKNTIVEHHFKNEYLFIKDILKSSVPEKTIKNFNEMKIAISLDLPASMKDIFCNGIRQNAFYLGELLLNIGYDTYFLVNKTYNEKLISDIAYDSRFKFIKHKKILKEEFDVMISIGYEIEKELLELLKYMNTKIVSYNCGNSYIIDTETMLYSQHEQRRNMINFIKKDENIPYDIIWTIPQMTNTNQYYWSTLFRTKCIEVPFIWSSSSIEFAMKSTNKSYNDLFYVKREKSKKVVIFEPNISIMKWCGPVVLICENAYRKDNECIKQVFINNINDKLKDSSSINKFNLDAFTVFVNNLDLCKDGKLSIEGRFNTLDFMNVYADVVVSHQWENNLNYLYFDLAWMGWPIVHNGSLCKDVGYYYEQFNYEEGGDLLLNVISNHDNDIDEYVKKNREAIDKYLTTNKELQEKYINLINDLYK
jgi:hypothetical protein